MPRAYDRRPLVIDRNPLWSIMPELPKLNRDAPAFYTMLIESIKNLTGLDLTSPETLVASIGDLISSGLGLDQIAKMFGFIDIPETVEQLGQWLRPHLFGQIPSWRLGNIPAAHIGNFNPELLDDPGFDFASTIANNPSYVWDGTVGRGSTLGSARTTADGTVRILRSNRFEVSPGQKLYVKAYAFWKGLTYTAGAGGPIRLSVTLYNGDTIVSSHVVSSVSPVSADASDWALLAGEYQIAAGATVTHAAVMLSVGSEATAGSVWFDDGSARKVGLIAQELIAGLQAAIQARIDEFQAVLDAFKGAAGGTIADIQTALNNAGQDIRDAIVQALGGTGTGHTAADVIAALMNIPRHAIEGLEDELADLGDGVADALEHFAEMVKGVTTGVWDPASAINNLIASLFGTKQKTNQIVEDVQTAWAGGTPTGTPTEVYDTITQIKSAIGGSYTVEVKTTSGTWVNPGVGVEFWAICIGSGGRGITPMASGSGGAGGRGGGYVAQQINPADLPATVDYVVPSGTTGAAPATFGSFATSLDSDTASIGSLVGYYNAADSKPANGGSGGGAQSAASVNGSRGGNTPLATGGAGGAGYSNTGGTGGTASDGSAGGNASLTGQTRAGGAGGGGGGGCYNANPPVTAQNGGNGGNGGFPGGGGGGGGGVNPSGVGTRTPGTGGYGGNGVIVLLYR